jgi:hypothetical protein
MGLDFTINIKYDVPKDVYFIDGSSCAVNERKKDQIDPFSLLSRVLEFSRQQFKDLKELIDLINSMDMMYIIRSKRESDYMKY